MAKLPTSELLGSGQPVDVFPTVHGSNPQRQPAISNHSTSCNIHVKWIYHGSDWGLISFSDDVGEVGNALKCIDINVKDLVLGQKQSKTCTGSRKKSDYSVMPA